MVFRYVRFTKRKGTGRAKPRESQSEPDNLLASVQENVIGVVGLF